MRDSDDPFIHFIKSLLLGRDPFVEERTAFRQRLDFLYTPQEAMSQFTHTSGFLRSYLEARGDSHMLRDPIESWANMATPLPRGDADRTPRGKPLAPLPDWLKAVDALLGEK